MANQDFNKKHGMQNPKSNEKVEKHGGGKDIRSGGDKMRESETSRQGNQSGKSEKREELFKRK